MVLISFMGCRIIKRLSKYDHIPPHLMELHWLNIRTYSLQSLCLMYKCIKGSAPQYWSEVVIKDHGCSLRSANLNNLPTVRCNTAIAHNSAFSSRGPNLWNMLPNDIKNSSDLEVFKTRLKTFLFIVSYDLHQ